MKKTTLILALLIMSISAVTFGQQINTTSTVTWVFDLGTDGQQATYSDGTAEYFSSNWVETSSENVILDKRGDLGVTLTRIQPTVKVNSKDANHYVSFNLRLASGLNFKPTSVSFQTIRYGTGGGKVDVEWKSSDGTFTVLGTGVVPNRNNETDPTTASYDLSGVSIPESDGDCGLYLYLYTLDNNKQVGYGNIIIEGEVSGELLSVTKYDVDVTSSSPEAGLVTVFPIGSSFDEGTEMTLTANRNFGYKFDSWVDSNTQEVVSTDNPYVFNLNADVNLSAKFSPLTTYTLDVKALNGAANYMIDISPAGNIVNGDRKYEAGTVVTLTAAENQIFTFNNWSSGSSNASTTVTMDSDVEIDAVYSSVDYIVGWDFYKAGNNGRPADFYSKAENETASLVLRNAAGQTSGWLDKSQLAAGGYEGKPAAVNWKDLTDNYYYQISFNAKDFVDITVNSSMLYNYNAHSIQQIEYSIDGTNFTKLDEITMSSAKTWYPNTVALPADANNQESVQVRWIPDYSSSVVGTDSEKDGTAIAEIFVFGSESIYDDGIAPVLVSSVPVENATNASATGKIVFTFDEKVKLVEGTTITLNGKVLTPTVSGNTITFSYVGLDYNTAYSVTLPANKVSDLTDNVLTSAITINFTTMNRPLVAKKTFDFVVGVDGDFADAVAAASTAGGERFRIFFPNGEYKIGEQTGDANQKTVFSYPNVSFIGQSSEGVILKNTNTNEGIGITATLNFTNSANNLYLQDLTLRNSDFRSGVASLGRCVALQDYGNKNIYKNVNVQSNQDTYYSGGGRYYFETSALHGTVDFLCGGGDVFFNETLLYLEDRANNCITAPATQSDWGYVFSNCTIDGFPSTNGNYSLGRPWQNAPKAVYINTTMKVLPSAAGWAQMGVVPALFAEYNSVTESGTPVDVSNRKTSYTYDDVTTPVNPWLSEEDANLHTIENVLGGNDDWQPTLYTEQAAVPEIYLDNNNVSWDNNDYTLCWAVFKDGNFVEFTTNNSYEIPSETTSGSEFSVRAANEMGGLSVESNKISYLTVDIKDVNLDRTVISKNYYSIDGKRIDFSENIYGIIIETTIYSDGSVESKKIVNLVK